MSKYFDTKPGSLEEAVSAAQQAAIAISKKEKGEKPKNEKDEDASQFAFVAQKAKEKGDKTFMFAGKKYDTETEEVIQEGELEMLKRNVNNPKQSDAAKKKMKARIAKLQAKEETLGEKVEYVEYKFKNKNDAMAAKKMLDAVQLMSFDINDDNINGGELMVDAGSKDMTKYHKEIMKKFKPKVMTQETNKNDKSDDGDGLDAVQPDAVKKKFKDRKDKDIDNDGDVDSSDKFLHKRRKAISKSMGESIMSVAESVRQMWDEAAKKNEAQDMEQDKDGDGMDDDGKAKKTTKKTDSGKDMTPVETSVKMPKLKNEKNKV